MAIMSRNGFAMSTQDNKELWGYYDNNGVLIAWWSPTLSQIKVNGNIVTSSPYTTPPVNTLTIDQSNVAVTKAYVNIKDPTLKSCRNMFSFLKDLKSVDVTNMNTSNANDMYMMFYGCRELKNVDVSNFVTSKVENYKWLFGICYNLKSIDLSNFDFTNACDLSQMFQWCMNVDSIDLSNKSIGTYGKSREFFGDRIVDGGDEWGCYELMYNCSKTKDGWYTYPPQKGTLSASDKVYECVTPLKSINLSNTSFNDETSFSYAFAYNAFLENVDFTNISNAYNKSSFMLFHRAMSLKNLDMSTWSWGKNCYGAFGGCYQLERIDVTNTNFSEVTNANSMFEDCRSLKYFDGSNIPNTTLTDATNLFLDCFSMEWCDLSAWTFENISSFYQMFVSCMNLRWVDLKNFNPPRATSPDFDGCYNLEWIYVDNVTDEVIWKIITTLNRYNYHLRYEYILGTKNGRKAIVRGE